MSLNLTDWPKRVQQVFFHIGTGIGRPQQGNGAFEITAFLGKGLSRNADLEFARALAIERTADMENTATKTINPTMNPITPDDETAEFGDFAYAVSGADPDQDPAEQPAAAEPGSYLEPCSCRRAPGFASNASRIS